MTKIPYTQFVSSTTHLPPWSVYFTSLSTKLASYSPHFADTETESYRDEWQIRCGEFLGLVSSSFSWELSAILLGFQSSKEVRKNVWPSFKRERAWAWDTKVAYETDRQLFKFPSAFSVPASTHPAHSTSQILSSSRRDMDLITLVLKCPQAFSEIFHFFQQQYVQFFPFFPYYIWKFVCSKTSSQWRAMPGSQKKNVHI